MPIAESDLTPTSLHLISVFQETEQRTTTSEILKAINEPDWGRRYWGCHVNSDVAEVWDELSAEARLVAYITAVSSMDPLFIRDWREE